mgnify:CR=1 FL=1
MHNRIIIKEKINNFEKKIVIPGDKSISIRWVLIASLASGLSQAKNLLLSEDVLAAIKVIKKLGVKVKFKNQTCKVYGVGVDGYKYKKGIILDAQNSGTLGRLIAGILINSPYSIKIIGDNSLSKRDFKRVADPLKEFGAKFELRNKNNLPLKVIGSEYLKPINYFEKRGSAQCKSSVILAALNTPGKTTIYAKKSRNHTELFLKYLKLPIKIIEKKKYDKIEISGQHQFKSFNYEIPGDVSSSAFFIVLTLLSKNSKLKIKNINVNPTRIGFIKIINKMGANVKFINKRIVCGEKLADICVKSQNNFKPINCPVELNSNAIDEFLIIFLLATKASGISIFKKLEELNKKESPRLKWGSKILNKMGIKNVTTNNSIKIFGNPNLKINKKIIIENYLKDHRVFMTSVVAALSFGGVWKIHDSKSIKTSFPNFLKVINQLKKK